MSDVRFSLSSFSLDLHHSLTQLSILCVKIKSLRNQRVHRNEDQNQEKTDTKMEKNRFKNELDHGNTKKRKGYNSCSENGQTGNIDDDQTGYANAEWKKKKEKRKVEKHLKNAINDEDRNGLEEHISCVSSVAVKSMLSSSEQEGRTSCSVSIQLPPTNKIMLASLPLHCNELHLRDYFSRFGHVVEAVVTMNMRTRISCGFGFITFASESAAERVLSNQHYVCGQLIEVIRGESASKSPISL